MRPSPDGYTVAAALLRTLAAIFGPSAVASLVDPKPNAPDDQSEGEAMTGKPTVRVLTAKADEVIVCSTAEPEDVIAHLRARWPTPGREFKITTTTKCERDPMRSHYLIKVRAPNAPPP